MSAVQSPTDFILSALRPRVAVMTSHSADVIAVRNNLSLVEILRPFSRLDSSVKYTDPLGSIVSVDGLALQFLSASPPPAVAGTPGVEMSPAAVRLLADTVRESCPVDFQCDQRKEESGTPWFLHWREVMLQLLPPGEHEFHRRFLACLLVVGCSLADSDPEPLIDQLLKLQQLQRQLQCGTSVTSQNKAPEACNSCWFSNNTLIHFVLLSDVSTTPQSSAASLFDGISAKFGERCCSHIRINSRPPALYSTAHEPDPWLPYLHLRRLNQDAGISRAAASAVVSGSDTPAELAQLVSLPAHIAEVSSHHPAVSSSPGQAPAYSPGSPDVLDHASDGSAMLRSESAPQLLPLNKVHYPRMEPAIPESASQVDGACMCEDDFSNIRGFVRNFTVTALLPHVERLMRSLNDTVGNRKGVSRSLLSATKRWFGSGKMSAANSTGHLNSVVYNQEAPEIQVRKMGDLAIMFGQYDIAYQAFHAVKRDFGNDTAWLHFAGAAEMAALAMFLHGATGKQFPQHYLQQATTTYSHTCRMPWYALRSTLYSAECLRSRGLYLDAALQFVKSTSEDNDLSTALFLEQAALCFIRGKMAARRKFAFHMVLAGHRFAKASQRQHSVRAYRQAVQVYAGCGWRYADDHIQFALARHCLALKDFVRARDAFTLLLNSAVSDHGAIGQHLGSQHALTLRELITVSQKCSSHPGRVSLNIPVVAAQRSVVLLSTRDADCPPEQSDAADNCERFSRAVFSEDPLTEPSWYQLEEQCCSCLSLNAGPIFRPTMLCMSHLTTNSHVQRIGADEPVFVKLLMTNPLSVNVHLSHVRLRCRLESSDGSETGGISCSETSCILPAKRSQYVTVTVSSRGLGTLYVDGVEYNLSMSEDGPSASSIGVEKVNGPGVGVNDFAETAGRDGECTVAAAPCITGYQTLEVRGARLNKSLQERRSCSYAPDCRFQFRVEERQCSIRAYLPPLTVPHCAGALLPITLLVQNCGSVPVSRLLLAFRPAGLLQLLDASSPGQTSSCLLRISDTAQQTGICLLQLSDTALPPGASCRHRLVLRVPCHVSVGGVQLLVVAAGGGGYCVERHSFRLVVTPSLRASVRAARVPPPETLTSSEEEVPALSALRLDLRAACDVESACSSLAVHQVSLLSSHWSLLPQQKTHGCCSLSGGEEELLSLSAVRRVSSSNSLSELLFSHCTFSDTSDELTGVCRYMAAEVLRQTVSQPADAEVQSAERISSRLMARAVSVSSVLAIHWQGTVEKDVSVRGVHFVYIDSLDDLHATYRQTVELRHREPITFSAQASTLQLRPDWWPGDDVVDKMVTVQLRHQQTVVHQFSRKRLCLIPVVVRLTNHTDCEVIAHVRAASDKQNEGSAASSSLIAGSRAPPSSLLWLGATRVTASLGAICGGPGAAVVRFTAAVSAAGVYNVAGVEVTCRRAIGADSELTVQQTESQSLVLVVDSDQVTDPVSKPPLESTTALPSL